MKKKEKNACVHITDSNGFRLCLFFYCEYLPSKAKKRRKKRKKEKSIIALWNIYFSHRHATANFLLPPIQNNILNRLLYKMPPHTTVHLQLPPTIQQPEVFVRLNKRTVYEEKQNEIGGERQQHTVEHKKKKRKK